VDGSKVGLIEGEDDGGAVGLTDGSSVDGSKVVLTDKDEDGEEERSIALKDESIIL